MGVMPEGIRRTRQRERVLSVLEDAREPLSAAEICSRASGGGFTVWISTVYRILEIFVKEGVVSKIAVMNGDTALYELAGARHRHYAVCVGCRRIISMSNCPMEQFLPLIDDSDFRVTGHNLEIYGYCGQCGDAAPGG
jgi:Fur family ferric uptake transcriptional regulator